MIRERLKHLNEELRTVAARFEDIPPEDFDQMTIEDIRAAFMQVTLLTHRLQELQKAYIETEAYIANS